MADQFVRNKLERRAQRGGPKGEGQDARSNAVPLKLEEFLEQADYSTVWKNSEI